MLSLALAGCAPRRLCPSVSRSNQGDTSRCTIPKRSQPCRKGRSHLAETISPARCLCNRLRPHLALEIFPARCWPSICRRDEIRRPTRMSFLTDRRAPQIQTPLRSANVYPPILRKPPHQSTQSPPRDSSPCLYYRFADRTDD